MGDDFWNHQVYVGHEDPEQARQELVQRIKSFFYDRGYSDAPDLAGATHRLVIGRPESWIPILDDGGYDDEDSDCEDPQAFSQLSEVISHSWPVVDVLYSDSAVVGFSLYRDGRIVDEFRSGEFPVFRFRTRKEAKKYAGSASLWADVLGSRIKTRALRKCWKRGSGASAILDCTANVLGWQQFFYRVGYTIGYDGAPVKYNEHFTPQGDGIDYTGVEEFQFLKSGSNT